MACEACSVKFSFFNRKKQCMDCLRHFCSECVIKRLDKMLSCDSCSVLSRRPLVRSQIAQMRSRDLRQYLLAKKVCVKGCVEKADLIGLLMLFANGTNSSDDTESDTDIASRYTNEQPTADFPMGRSDESSVNVVNHPTDRSDRPDRPDRPDRSDRPDRYDRPDRSDQHDHYEPPDQSVDQRIEIEGIDDVGIEEISGSDSSTHNGPEPLITEQDEVSSISERLDAPQPETLTEIPVRTGLVKLSDINESSELECLSVKQLKNLLSTNCVDYKGCVERRELLDRASKLWEEYKQSRTDVEQLDEEDLCKICWDAPIECVILECGHMVCCINCGKQMSECPICKQYVVRVIRFFKA